MSDKVVHEYVNGYGWKFQITEDMKLLSECQDEDCDRFGTFEESDLSTSGNKNYFYLEIARLAARVKKMEAALRAERKITETLAEQIGECPHMAFDWEDKDRPEWCILPCSADSIKCWREWARAENE